MTTVRERRNQAGVLQDDLPGKNTRMSRGWPRLTGYAVFVVAAVLVPLSVVDPFWSSLIVLWAITGIGAIGLNLSMGYAGQLSLGHSAFLAVGAYTAAVTGGDLGWPLYLWLPAVAIVAGLLGCFVGLFTLRLRGPYLAIVSLGLVFFTIYLFNNWESVSGGVNGLPFDLPSAIGPIDFTDLTIGGVLYGREQGLGVLCWLLVGLSLLISHNIVRSGFGRAMLAVREQDIAAEVLGVRPFHTKVVALGIGSALGGIAGALLANELQYVLPAGFDLHMSIQYVAIIVLGGMGTTFGPLLGAAFVTAVPQLINMYAEHIPFVKEATDPGFGLTKDNAGLVIYGVLIVVTLIAEPEGLSGLGRRLRDSLQRAFGGRRKSAEQTAH
ncbi:branched-chain amino acid ABC transporter permease [Streptosporangium sp. CA-115845]|uniref:branched-chain amino acid ABC transporter permease n=1 Tax=Streptosporangium sp. CA-115845 TaxID=3240071 RepID=UPI003D91E014